MGKVDNVTSMGIAMMYRRLVLGEDMPADELAKLIMADSGKDGEELDWMSVLHGLSCDFPTHDCSIFDDMVKPGKVVSCGLFEDSLGIQETLSFLNSLAMKNFLNRYGKVFHLVSDLGLGTVMPAMKGQVAPIMLQSGYQAVLSPLNSRVLNGELSDFSYADDEWQKVPGAITSFIGNLADPVKGKSLLADYDNGEVPHNYATTEKSTQAFEGYRPLVKLFRAMNVPEITIVTRQAAQLIDNCKLTASVEDLDRLITEPIVLKGQDRLTGDILEIALMKDEEENAFMLAQEHLYHGHRSCAMSYFDIGSVKSEVQPLEEERAADSPMTGIREKGNEAFEFAVKYLLLRRAEKTPVASVETDRKGNRMKKGLHAIPRYSTVSLTREYRARREAYDKTHPVTLDREGKHLTTVTVSGFIRQQVCGKGRAERKTIWVDAFDRGQWVNDGIRIVRVVK